MKLSQQLTALIVVVLLGLMSLGAYGLYSLRNTLIESRKHELESVLTFAKKQVEQVVNAEAAGKLTKAAAEQQVIDLLSQYRDGATYVWSNDNNGIARVHVKKEKLGQVQASYQGHIAALQNTDFIFDVGPNFKPGSTEEVLKVNAVTKIPGWNWVMGLGVYMDDLNEVYWSFALRFVAIAVGIIIAITAMVVMTSRSILRKLGGEPNYAVAITNRIAQGNLDEQITGHFSHDSLLGAITTMQNSLKHMVASIQTASSRLLQATEKLSAEFSVIADSSQKSSDASISTSAAIQELSHCIHEISVNAKATEANSHTSHDTSNASVALVGKSSSTITQMAEKIESSVHDFKALQVRTGEIGNIVKVISAIAEQTNLLALNAAIEAARAGEQGRGFAVVADEVRALASRTATATSEITDTISVIQKETDRVADELSSVLPIVANNVEITRSVSQVLQEITASTDNTLTMIREVSSATSEQQIASNELAEHVSFISGMVSETASAVTSCHTAVAELDTLAHDLIKSVSLFSTR